MYNYIRGTVKECDGNCITVENNGIGYSIFVANPFSFQLDSEVTIYIYQYVREDEISLYGFKNRQEKNLFLKLIEVKGLGCKMALPMLATGSIDNIVGAIEREDISYLKKFPKIGDKVAKQIILDLKGKVYTNNLWAIEDASTEELVEVLKGLGYKSGDISKILPSINKSNSLENQIKEALKLLLK